MQLVKIPASLYLIVGGHHFNFRCLTDMIDLFIRRRCLLTDWFVRTETVDSSIYERKKELTSISCEVNQELWGDLKKVNAFREKKILNYWENIVFCEIKFWSYSGNPSTHISFSKIPGLDQLFFPFDRSWTPIFKNLKNTKESYLFSVKSQENIKWNKFLMCL